MYWVGTDGELNPGCTWLSYNFLPDLEKDFVT